MGGRSAAGEHSSQSAGPGRTRWPFVGRATERAFVAQTLRAGQAGVVLSGPAGVGKTQLALEALRDAEQQQGCLPLWVVATRAAASIPFGPFAHLLPQLPVGSLDRLDLLRQITEALVARTGGDRLVVGIDDAHLLDDASAALVHQLVLSGSAFVVVTLRAGEVTADSIVALWKDGLAERLDLGALSEEEVAELVPRVLGGQIDTPTMGRLWRATRGNALFLRELVLSGAESGTLVETGGVWTWKGQLELSLRLREIVAARLGTLDPDQTALIELLAHGEPVGASVLEQLVSATALDGAERRGVVTVELSGRRTLVRLAHPLYGEVARAQCPTLRARRIHRQLAAAVEATEVRRSDDLLRLAAFRLEAGEPGRPDVLLAGARRALAVFDLRLSERLARAAIDGGGGLPATLALAQSLVDQARGAEAAQLLHGVDGSGLTEAEVAATSMLRAYATSMGLGRPRDAEEILLRAEKAVLDPDWQEDLRALRGVILAFAGDTRGSITVAQAVLAGTSDRACVRVIAAAVFDWAVSGQTERARRAVEEWIDPVRRMGGDFPFVLFQLHAAHAAALYLSGRLAEATVTSREAYLEAVTRNAEQAIALLACLRGGVALARGRAATAVRWLREGAAGLRGSSRINYLPFCLSLLAQSSVFVGDLTAAASALTEAEASLTPAVGVFRPHLDLAGAWLASGRGEMSRARTLALEAAKRAEERGQHAVVVLAMHDLARFGDPRPEQLSQLAPCVDGPFAGGCAAHAKALLARDGAGLDQAATSFAQMGAHLLAAEAAIGAAAVHAAEGMKDAMSASQERARQLRESCEGAWAPFPIGQELGQSVRPS